MKIGFDLDKVFIDTPPFIPKNVIDRLYKKRDNGVLLYRIPGTHEQLIRKLSHLTILRPAMTENLNFLKSIPRQNNKIYLISSRFKFLEHRTKRLIQKHKLNQLFDGMYFNFLDEQPHHFKNRIIKNLKLDLYIDDDLSLLYFVAKHNPKIKFFWLTDKSVRKMAFPNVHPISRLQDIYNLSNKIFVSPK